MQLGLLMTFRYVKNNISLSGIEINLSLLWSWSFHTPQILIKMETELEKLKILCEQLEKKIQGEDKFKSIMCFICRLAYIYYIVGMS